MKVYDLYLTCINMKKDTRVKVYDTERNLIAHGTTEELFGHQYDFEKQEVEHFYIGKDFIGIYLI